MTDIFDTTWGQLPELVQKQVQELGQAHRDRHVRMSIIHLLDKDLVIFKESSEGTTRILQQPAEWVRRLRDLGERQPHLAHEVDDSRDTIYSEAVRDPG